MNGVELDPQKKARWQLGIVHQVQANLIILIFYQNSWIEKNYISLDPKYKGTSAA